MEHSASAPAVGRKATAVPGMGWAKLKKNLRTQRVVKQCCGVDFWEIDSFAEEMGQVPSNQHEGEEHVKNIRNSMMSNSGVRPGGHPVSSGAPKEITEALTSLLNLRRKYSGESVSRSLGPLTEKACCSILTHRSAPRLV